MDALGSSWGAIHVSSFSSRLPIGNLCWRYCATGVGLSCFSVQNRQLIPALHHGSLAPSNAAISDCTQRLAKNHSAPLIVLAVPCQGCKTGGMCSFYPMIDALYSHFMLIPMVPFAILDSLHQKLVLAQTLGTSGVPCPPSLWPTASGFPKVCANYPLHLLDRSGALGATALPFPPRIAFFVKSKGPW